MVEQGRVWSRGPWAAHSVRWRKEAMDVKALVASNTASASAPLLPPPPPHPQPAQVSPGPSADPGGAWATLFVCLSFGCLLCQRAAFPIYVHIPLPSSHSFPHNQTLRPQRSRDSFLASCDVEYCVQKSRKPTFPKLRYVPVCSRVPQTPRHFLKHRFSSMVKDPTECIYT